jgi:hypothetical protein
MASAISKGQLFLGRQTLQLPVYYIDFENPEAIVIDRSRILNITEVLFWLQTSSFPPPRIDSDGYEVYKRLPPGLLIFDSLRASQSGDENSSKDMAFAMQRYKELRDYGHTIILIHHTMKANEQSFRGSMAILDLADHVLSFFPVRKPGDDTAIEGDDLNNMTFFFGTREKTRFAQVKLYMKRANGRFEIAGHPDDEKLEDISALLFGKGQMKQQDIQRLIKDEMGIGKDAALHLLKLGAERELWKVEKGKNNSNLFSSFRVSSPKGEEENPQTESGQFFEKTKTAVSIQPQLSECTGFSGVPSAAQKTRKQAIEADPRYLDGVALFLNQGLSQDEAEQRTWETFKEKGWVL